MLAVHVIKTYNNRSGLPSVAVAACGIAWSSLPIGHFTIDFLLRSRMVGIDKWVGLQSFVNFSCVKRETVTRTLWAYNESINRITLKAYEHTFADRALVFRSYFCCHGSQCREKCDSLGWVCCNTSDFQLASYKRRVWGRASRRLLGVGKYATS